MKANLESNEKEINLFNLLILFLSVYVLVALVITTFFQIDQEVERLLNYIDNIICIFFLIDFIKRLFASESKMAFLKWGWIDLVASIPNFEIFRAGRLLRLFRLIRIFRALKSLKLIVGHINQQKAKSASTSIILIGILMLIFSSISILQFEKDVNSNIRTAEDALWWSYVTMTTVGYGDKFPVTTEGRIIGAVLMTTGVGLFGTFTALVSSWFMKK